MRISRKSIVFLCAIAPLCVANAADTGTTNTGTARPSLKASDLFTNSIVARAKGGISITRSQLDEAVIGVRTGAAARGQRIPPEMQNVLERDVLQNLIRVQLVNSKATDADRKVAQEGVEKRFAALKTQAGSEDMLQKQLQSMGLTIPELKVKMVEELTADAVVKRELQADVKDEDLKKYYDENPAKFEQPEMVRAAHVLISTKDPSDTNTPAAMQRDLPDDKKQAKLKEAQDVLKKARAGEDFAELAKKYSDDPGSKDKGGEYKFGRGQMIPAFESAAFSLNTNQISDIVTTPYGYHIIKLYEKFPASKLEFDKVKEDLKDYLVREQLQAKIPDYMEKLEKESNVEILDENLKPRDTAETPGLSPAVRAPAATGGK